MNTFVTVSFEALAIDDDHAGAIFQDFYARLSRWWRYERSKGKVSGSLVGAFSHANPAGNRHVHWLMHIPEEMEAAFAAKAASFLKKITRSADLGDALDIRPAPAPGSLAKYMLRGIDPIYGEHFRIRPADEGFVSCRRTGVSRAISKTARERASWRRKS